MAINFSTKADTLSSLQCVIKSARIAPLFIIKLEEWLEKKEGYELEIMKKIGVGPFVVRSSSKSEDSLSASNAGAYLSILNVANSDLRMAINKVFSSYKHKCSLDQVLIQPMLMNVIKSGVAFSHDPNTCAPYRVINWSEGKDTTKVTSGFGGKVWQQAASAPIPIKSQSGSSLSIVINLLSELLELFSNQPVDCEFAVTQEQEGEILWLLQVRPLILPAEPESNFAQADRLKVIFDKLSRGMREQPQLMGGRTIYGVMPDWNPAEIIGIRPRPLALSLYRELVTDSIWAYQRHNYGYRNLRSFPLMPHFFGLPYIDVRVSFNSFIPADLEQNLASKLVEYYMDSLLQKPYLHDKVEFEIVFSCYTLDLPQRLKQLDKFGFSISERKKLATSLLNLTNNIVNSKNGLWLKDVNKINLLNTRRTALHASNLDKLGQIYWLLEDAKRYGTLPFAGLARTGFIAIQMLQSLVSTGIFSPLEYDAFMSSIKTIGTELSSDYYDLDKNSFLAKYGHLRPGTYDILSHRYDKEPDLYFDWMRNGKKPPNSSPFILESNKFKYLTSILESHKIRADPLDLFKFIRSGVRLRELAKFHFSHNLSNLMELIAEIGEAHGFSRDDLSYCDIRSIVELHIAALDTRQVLRESIDRGKSQYTNSLKISLPPLIVNPEDIYAFEWPESTPNFITQKKIIAKTCDASNQSKLAGAIVCIPNADPGFDWLFSHSIAGLITAWGGANSHMAIRAGELGLPSVIGAGEILYQRWSNAQMLSIDCATKKVEILI
jgi:phosphohistidine swiveling domain-containing protein